MAGGEAASLAKDVTLKREAEEKARGEQKEKAWLKQEAEGAALAKREGDQRVAAHKQRRVERNREEQRQKSERVKERVAKRTSAAAAVQEGSISGGRGAKAQPRRAGRFASGLLGRLGGRR